MTSEIPIMYMAIIRWNDDFVIFVIVQSGKETASI